MESKIQLQHPDGKKAVSIDKGKYDTLKRLILRRLKTKEGLTHKELLRVLKEDLKKNNIKFEGSLEWYMEWVKLDMEAKNEIKRIEDKSPLKYTINKIKN